MENSVVGEKGDDHAERNCENKDNINGAGKGGVVDEGGNVMNDTDETTKIEKFQQETLTKNNTLHFINAEEYAGVSEACLLFHGLRKLQHLCNIIFKMMLR